MQNRAWSFCFVLLLKGLCHGNNWHCIVFYSFRVVKGRHCWRESCNYSYWRQSKGIHAFSIQTFKIWYLISVQVFIAYVSLWRIVSWCIIYWMKYRPWDRYRLHLMFCILCSDDGSRVGCRKVLFSFLLNTGCFCNVHYVSLENSCRLVYIVSDSSVLTFNRNLNRPSYVYPEGCVVTCFSETSISTWSFRVL